METVRLAGCVIPDEENQVVLLHRIDHNQWQLPGGRLRQLPGGAHEDPINTVIREARNELNLDVRQDQLHWLGYTIFRQGVVDYSCEWYKADAVTDEPFLLQPELYDNWDRFNLVKRNLGKISLSPNVEELRQRLLSGRIHL